MKYSNYPAVEAFCRENADEIDERFLSFVDATIAIFDEYGFDKGCDIALTLLAMAQ